MVKPRLPITAGILSTMCDALRSGVFGPYDDLLLETAFCRLAFLFAKVWKIYKSNTFDINAGYPQVNMKDRFFTLH